jgi:hypothetical protein
VESVSLCPKVITLSGFHCILDTQMKELLFFVLKDDECRPKRRGRGQGADRQTNSESLLTNNVKFARTETKT